MKESSRDRGKDNRLAIKSVFCTFYDVLVLFVGFLAFVLVVVTVRVESMTIRLW